MSSAQLFGGDDLSFSGDLRLSAADFLYDLTRYHQTGDDKFTRSVRRSASVIHPNDAARPVVGHRHQFRPYSSLPHGYTSPFVRSLKNDQQRAKASTIEAEEEIRKPTPATTTTTSTSTTAEIATAAAAAQEEDEEKRTTPQGGSSGGNESTAAGVGENVRELAADSVEDTRCPRKEESTGQRQYAKHIDKKYCETETKTTIDQDENIENKNLQDTTGTVINHAQNCFTAKDSVAVPTQQQQQNESIKHDRKHSANDRIKSAIPVPTTTAKLQQDSTCYSDEVVFCANKHGVANAKSSGKRNAAASSRRKRFSSLSPTRSDNLRRHVQGNSSAASGGNSGVTTKRKNVRCTKRFTSRSLPNNATCQDFISHRQQQNNNQQLQCSSRSRDSAIPAELMIGHRRDDIDKMPEWARQLILRQEVNDDASCSTSNTTFKTLCSCSCSAKFDSDSDSNVHIESPTNHKNRDETDRCRCDVIAGSGVVSAIEKHNSKRISNSNLLYQESSDDNSSSSCVVPDDLDKIVVEKTPPLRVLYNDDSGSSVATDEDGGGGASIAAVVGDNDGRGLFSVKFASEENMADEESLADTPEMVKRMVFVRDLEASPQHGRRRARHSGDSGNGRIPETNQPSAGGAVTSLSPAAAAYNRLVFLTSSDSSSKEEDFDNDCECDWDYFEPQPHHRLQLRSEETVEPPGGSRDYCEKSDDIIIVQPQVESPAVEQKTVDTVLQKPLASPDTEKSEAATKIIESPPGNIADFKLSETTTTVSSVAAATAAPSLAATGASGGAGGCCESCGSRPRYVPVPIPVPIPVPVPWWAPRESLVLFRNDYQYHDRPPALLQQHYRHLAPGAFPDVGPWAAAWPGGHSLFWNDLDHHAATAALGPMYSFHSNSGGGGYHDQQHRMPLIGFHGYRQHDQYGVTYDTVATNQAAGLGIEAVPPAELPAPPLTEVNMKNNNNATENVVKSDIEQPNQQPMTTDTLANNTQTTKTQTELLRRQKQQQDGGADAEKSINKMDDADDDVTNDKPIILISKEKSSVEKKNDSTTTTMVDVDVDVGGRGEQQVVGDDVSAVINSEEVEETVQEVAATGACPQASPVRLGTLIDDNTDASASTDKTVNTATLTSDGRTTKHNDPAAVVEEEEISCHLASECAGDSSSAPSCDESADETATGENREIQKSTTKNNDSYDITVFSDEEQHSDTTSSSSEDDSRDDITSESESDDDVKDSTTNNRRTTTKKFSKVFTVNQGDSDSDDGNSLLSEYNSVNSDTNEDLCAAQYNSAESDDGDCGVVLLSCTARSTSPPLADPPLPCRNSSGSGNAGERNASSLSTNALDDGSSVNVTTRDVINSETSGSVVSNSNNNGAKYKSLVMITQHDNDDSAKQRTRNNSDVLLVENSGGVVRNVENNVNTSGGQVSVVTSDTTILTESVIVHHTNHNAKLSGVNNDYITDDEASKIEEIDVHDENMKTADMTDNSELAVRVVTGGDTLSAVVCLEEGLADDDSWVEDLGSHDEDNEDEFATTTATESDSGGEEALMAMLVQQQQKNAAEDLRNFQRTAIDFTLHTIAEESCEDSESESGRAGGNQTNNKRRPLSSSELEKYFYFGLCDANGSAHHSNANNSGQEISLNNPAGSVDANSGALDEVSSETSSVYSEGVDSLGPDGEEENVADNEAEEDSAERLASSRLEKYFLTGFMGFTERRGESDGSGSVGSDSEGRPSPEQRRKRLVRARGTGRSSHSSSLDNLLVEQNLSGDQQQSTQQQAQVQQLSQQQLDQQQDASAANVNDSTTSASGVQQVVQDVSSSESDEASGEDNTTGLNFEKTDGFDTVKRKQKHASKKFQTGGVNKTHVSSSENITDDTPTGNADDAVENNQQQSLVVEEDDLAIPQAEFLHMSAGELASSRSKQHSRDSGFIGSCDDLLKEQRNNSAAAASAVGAVDDQHSGVGGGSKMDKQLAEIAEENTAARPESDTVSMDGKLSRKDSFNNWSSDEETNMMMCKMRQFFKTMVAGRGQQNIHQTSSGNTVVGSGNNLQIKSTKSPQLLYFESELTRLMKTVPGIREDQVREIVEYLSSEDTWSDSCDSSDYTSSDLEGAMDRTALRRQISDSCRRIISKFDAGGTTGDVGDEEGDAGDGGVSEEALCLNRETAFVYQKLVAEMTKKPHVAAETEQPSQDDSPPLIAKVMHHIGSRLVALMQEVSSSGGESHHSAVVSPRIHKSHHHHHHHYRRNAACQQHQQKPSSTEEDDEEEDDDIIDRVLLPRSKSHDPLLADPVHASDEREASDYERFSWRGSFESALMTGADSRTKLSLLSGADQSASAVALAAKRRSAGDLLFGRSHSPGRAECLDRVRSCGSIGRVVTTDGGDWSGGDDVTANDNSSAFVHNMHNRRRSSVPDCNEDTSDEDCHGAAVNNGGAANKRSTTLPRTAAAAAIQQPGVSDRNQQQTASASNSLPRAHQFLQNNVKSARYRAPGFGAGRAAAGVGGGPKRAVSAPGLQQQGGGGQQAPPRRETARRRIQQQQQQQQQQLLAAQGDDSGASAGASPLVRLRSGSSSAGGGAGHQHSHHHHQQQRSGGSSSSSSVTGGGGGGGGEWTAAHSASSAGQDEDLDRLMRLQSNRSLSSLGLRSDSMASVYSGAGDGRYGAVAVKGEVEFGLQYNYKTSSLQILVRRARDLAQVDAKRSRSDPYVKVYLLPDKSKSGKRKTKVKKHTVNPVFDETLSFQLSLDELKTRTLWLTVWHSDMFGRNDFLGEVMMSLEDKLFDDPAPMWYPLQERTEPFEETYSHKGDIILALKFVPPSTYGSTDSAATGGVGGSGSFARKHKKSQRGGALHVLVKEAKNLVAVKANGTSDPFCKSYLLPDKGRSSKQKTPVLRRNLNPAWNYTFVYDDVTESELRDRALELTVWDHDRLGSNEFLGMVRLSLGTGRCADKTVDWMDASDKEVSLWSSMLDRPNFWVESCIALRANSFGNTKNTSSSSTSSTTASAMGYT